MSRAVQPGSSRETLSIDRGRLYAALETLGAIGS